MEYDELMQQINSAFADAPAPAEDNIVCHECEECFALRDDVGGKIPDDLSDDWVERSFDQLPLLSDEAKRFYFPAFFRVAALKPDSLVTQFTLFSLSDDFRMQPDGGYSPQQKQAIRNLLAFLKPRVGDSEREYVEKAETLWQSDT